MQSRPLTIDDIEQIDAIRRDVLPWHTATVDQQREWFRQDMSAAKPIRIGVDIGGQLVGFAAGGLELHTSEPNAASLHVMVMPSARRQGIGTLLLDDVHQHLRAAGGRRVKSFTHDRPADIKWATDRGYQAGAAEVMLSVDPRNANQKPAWPPGFTVKSAGEAGPETYYTVDDVASRDEPGDLDYAGMPFDDWVKRHWVGIDQQASVVGFMDGQPVAVSALMVNPDSGRAISAGSSTLREFRGRGLMKALKVESLCRAAAQGVRTAFTGNDQTNAPMLAINRWLGYQPCGGTRSVLTTLS
jgi:GNAT superfamily N-acetyltransferase